jgi:hypothetical protein
MGTEQVVLTRKQFNALTRRLSVQDPATREYHCRVEICVADDWRILTDTCVLERNIPAVHAALTALLWVYVSEHMPGATPADCRKLGEPTHALDKGMKVWV